VPLYPPVEPYESGHLEASDGNRLHWEECGNPAGKPAIVLHGGPGSGCTPGMRRWFDPEAYRVVLFDQRNCGRSTPHASDFAVSLESNTTPHLLRDIELLREHLGIERWLVWGGSWGSTLALAYSEAHPERVSEAVLAAVTAGIEEGPAWLYHGVGRYFPEAWERFRDALPPRYSSGDLVAGYYRALHDADPGVREAAALNWCEWEDTIFKLDPREPPLARYADPRFRMAFARIVTHYFCHRAWLEERKLLRGVQKLAGIPAILIHGRLDLGSPLQTAWALHRAWPGSQLVITNSGHSSADPSMADAIVSATDRFRSSQSLMARVAK
jgi:proline iminopeptidase